MQGPLIIQPVFISDPEEASCHPGRGGGRHQQDGSGPTSMEAAAFCSYYDPGLKLSM